MKNTTLLRITKGKDNGSLLNPHLIKDENISRDFNGFYTARKGRLICLLRHLGSKPRVNNMAVRVPWFINDNEPFGLACHSVGKMSRQSDNIRYCGCVTDTHSWESHAIFTMVKAMIITDGKVHQTHQ